MNKDIIAWLGWVVASPLAVLALVAFLLVACAPVAPCPDLRCEYGYGEAPAEAPARTSDCVLPFTSVPVIVKFTPVSAPPDTKESFLG